MCTARALPTDIRVTDHDATDETWTCTRLNDAVSIARLAYYATKLWKYLLDF